MNSIFPLLHSAGCTHKDLFHIYEKHGKILETDDVTLSILESCITPVRAQKIFTSYKQQDHEKILSLLYKINARVISYFCDEYPESLKHIAHPPFIIYVRGKIPNTPKLSVVGSRSMSHYGKQVIEKIIPDLARSMCIVSGGALGCDAMAHQYALSSQGSTVVVLGSGIDQLYPKTNSDLFREILSHVNSAIISSFPFGTIAESHNFPIRNEIVVGLSLGTLLIEAKKKSGSMITAALTLDMGRDLFAIPGSIFSRESEGTNSLILAGSAQPVNHSNDIIECYSKQIQLSNQDSDLSVLQKEIVALLSQGLSLDTISVKLGLLVSEINFLCSELELAGILKSSIGGGYRLK